jgi:nitrate reductase beta subunit
LAQQVADFVSDQEGKIQSSLEDMYRSMGQETFKDMRRILPISKQKMDWSGAQMALAKSFSGGAGSAKSSSKSKSKSSTSKKR